ncbi:MAG: DUF4870 domain-containing protein [Pirellulales bacterium]
MDEQTNAYDAPPPPVDAPLPAAVPDKDARMWAMLCHLSALSMYFTGVGSIVGPLIVWLIKKDDHPLIDDQGKESLNFEISILIYTLVLAIPSFCLMFIPIIVLAVAHVVLIIVASIRANAGEAYRYPLTIRLIH